MRLTNWLSAGPAAFLAALAFVAPAAAQETGSIKGTFVLKGAAPKLPEPTVNKDQAVCANPTPPNEMLVVDPETKGIANVFVWVSDADKVPADLKKPEKPEVTVDNQNCRFVPHCLIAHSSQQLHMLNSDSVGHNVRVTLLTGGAAINDLVPPNDKNGIKKPIGKAQRLPMPVACDIHPWMKAHVLILDHPFAALSNEKGEFTIEGLPPGKYDLKVWHEAGGSVAGAAGIKGVEVKAGSAADAGKTEIDLAKLKNLK